ncbi:MAG: GNAT family N-acetyltransferase [Ignavibacteriaceae bacterium]|jgi:RimJ/RimL family protein N-acetyltransferase
MYKNVEIKELQSEQASTLSALILNTPKDHTKYFTPFSFEEDSVKKIINDAVNDKYFGIFINDELAGFYMLRGFDEGYEVPSYGVWISDKFSGLGLSKLTLQHAITFCKLNGLKKIMLKVHPKNIISKSIYEAFDFKQEGFDEKNSNLIYYKSLD